MWICYQLNEIYYKVSYLMGLNHNLAIVQNAGKQNKKGKYESYVYNSLEKLKNCSQLRFTTKRDQIHIQKHSNKGKFSFLFSPYHLQYCLIIRKLFHSGSIYWQVYKIIYIYQQCMINNVPVLYKNSNACTKCGSEFSLVGDVRYCEHCGQCPIIIDEELKIVPRNYRSNAVDYKITALIKIEEHVRDFLLGLQLDEPQSKIYQLVEKIMTLHRSRGENCKGYREETAAIIYCVYQFDHKLTIKKFCQKNNLQIRKFNKMYLLHRNMERQIARRKERVQIQEPQFTKLEEKENIQQYVKYEEQEEKNVKIEAQAEEKQRIQEKKDKQEEKKIIEASIIQMYDIIFDRTYFQRIKSNFMKSFVSKAFLISSQLKSQQEFEAVKKYLHIPYLIYGVLKGNGFSISMKKYKAIAEKILKVELREKMLTLYLKETKKILEKWEQEDTISESFVTRSVGE